MYGGGLIFCEGRSTITSRTDKLPRKMGINAVENDSVKIWILGGPRSRRILGFLLQLIAMESIRKSGAGNAG